MLEARTVLQGEVPTGWVGNTVRYMHHSVVGNGPREKIPYGGKDSPVRYSAMWIRRRKARTVFPNNRTGFKTFGHSKVDMHIVGGTGWKW